MAPISKTSLQHLRRIQAGRWMNYGVTVDANKGLCHVLATNPDAIPSLDRGRSDVVDPAKAANRGHLLAAAGA
jgi:hypothetical protein